MPLMSKFEFDERLRSLQMEVLDENRSFLCETITPSRHYPYLRQVKVLSRQGQETIESKATSTARANALIDELQSNGGPKAFTSFLEALLKDGTQSHVISKLNRDLEAKRDTPDVRDAIHQSQPHEPPPGERRLERVPTEDDDIDTINSPLSSLESATFDPEPSTRPEFTPPTMPSFGILSNLTSRVSPQDGPTLIPHGNSSSDNSH